MKYKVRYTSDPNTIIFNAEEETTYEWVHFKHPQDKVEEEINDDPQKLHEPLKSLATSILGISEVTELRFDVFDIGITKKSDTPWFDILPKLQDIIGNYHDTNARRKKFKQRVVTQARKNKIAAAIEEGLHLVKEDHGVFVSSETDPRYVCGCVLIIAVAGSQFKSVETALEMERHINGGSSAIELASGILQIPDEFASKLDKMHRIDMISAQEIARQLRAGVI